MPDTRHSKPSPMLSPAPPRSSDSGTSRSAPARYGDGNQPTPPWPRADHQRLLVHVLQLPIEDLGFTPPWDVSVSGPDAAAAARHPLPARHEGHTAASAVEGAGRDPALQRGKRLRGHHRRLPAPVRQRRAHAAAPAGHRAHPHGRPAAQRDSRGQPHHPGHRPGRDTAPGRADRVLRPAPARRRRRQLRPRPASSR